VSATAFGPSVSYEFQQQTLGQSGFTRNGLTHG
jgi:hypothetical protein